MVDKSIRRLEENIGKIDRISSAKLRKIFHLKIGEINKLVRNNSLDKFDSSHIVQKDFSPSRESLSKQKSPKKE